MSWDDLATRWSTRKARRLHDRIARRYTLHLLWRRIPLPARIAIVAFAAVVLIGVLLP